MPQERWYVRVGSGEVGPITAQRLLEMLREGQVEPQSMARPESAELWTRVEQVERMLAGSPQEYAQEKALNIPGLVPEDVAVRARSRRLAIGAGAAGVLILAVVVTLAIVVPQGSRRTGLPRMAPATTPGPPPDAPPRAEPDVGVPEEPYLKEALRLEGYPGVTKSLAFSGDGRWLLSGGGAIDRAVFRDTEEFEDEALNPAPPEKGAEPAGTSRPATERKSPNAVWIWEVRSGTGAKILEGHTALVRAVAFSPDGLLALSADVAGTAILWDVRKAAPLGRFQGKDRKTVGLGETRAINAVAFFSGQRDHRRALLAGWGYAPGESIAEMDRQAQLIVWDLQARREVLREGASGKPSPFFPPPAFTDEFHSVACSGDGAYVVAGASGSNAGVYYFNAQGTAFEATAPSLPGGLGAETEPAGGADQPEPARAPRRSRSSGHDWPSASYVVAAISADGRRMVSGDTTGRLCLWSFGPSPTDPSRGVSRVAAVQMYGKAILCAAFSPDGRYFATGGDDLYLWAPGGSKLKVAHELGPRPVGAFYARPYHVHSVAFSPDGRYLAAGCDDRVIRIWKVP